MVETPRLTNVSIIIPTLNAGRRLPACLVAVIGVGEIIIVDGGSSDDTVEIASAGGARVIEAPRGRGQQMVEGQRHAKADWLLFLHADTVLGKGWAREVLGFMAQPTNAGRAAVFGFALDEASPRARVLERMVAARCKVFALPYGDQGLLISRTLYDEIGGFKPLPLMEDVDIVRRLGRARIVRLQTAAVTSADRWRQEGWGRRSARNLGCLALYSIGVSPQRIARIYGA
jgi:rSAM/selenodomain-associated transferase 2